MISRPRPVVALGVLAFLLLLALVLGISLGSVRVPLATVVRVLLGGSQDPAESAILLDVRLPRVILAAVVGAALSTAGAAFQGLLRNPLADPFILGTSSGAAFAATLLIATGIARGAAGPFLMPVASFAGALVALAVVWLLARSKGRVAVETLLLSGVIVNAFLFALVLLVLAVARLEAVEILLWLMGSLSLAIGSRLVVVVACMVTVGWIAIWVQSRELDVMSLGEEQAALLGVGTERLKRRLFVVISLVVGAAVSVSGIIGFVGLIVPHLARMLVGAAHRILLPASALLGAAFLVAADLAARTVLTPRELPVGVVTALAGAPFFVALLRRQRRAF